MTKKLLYSALASIGAIALISWGAVGHRTVALIAEKYTDVRVMATVSRLLDGQEMDAVATWADEVRNQPEYKHTAPWHFLNEPLGLNHDQFVAAVHAQKQENIYTAILKQEKVLSDKAATKEQKAEALKFLIHFVGDAHQPMHISRAEDKGGNTIQVQFDGRGTNLHSLWDSRLIDKTGETADQLANEYFDKQINSNGSQEKKIQADSVMQWLWESYQISSKLYAEVEASNKLGDEYYNAHIPIVKERIGVAGVRLAGLLNKFLYDPKVKITSVTLTPPPLTTKPSSATPITEIKLSEVSKHIGETVSVEGKAFSHRDMGSFVLVNIGGEYPNQLLTVLLRGEAKSLAVSIEGKNIKVSGKMIDYKGRAEIEINDPQKISIP